MIDKLLLNISKVITKDTGLRTETQAGGFEEADLQKLPSFAPMCKLAIESINSFDKSSGQLQCLATFNLALITTVTDKKTFEYLEKLLLSVEKAQWGTDQVLSVERDSLTALNKFNFTVTSVNLWLISWTQGFFIGKDVFASSKELPHEYDVEGSIAGDKENYNINTKGA